MLTDPERERVRYHMGYQSVSFPTILALGVPATGETQFILERALQNVLPEAEPGVRRAIQELDCIEDQLSTMRGSLEVSAAGGGVKLRGPEAFRELEEQYVFWVTGLSDTLGSPVNPMGHRLSRLGLGGSSVIEPV